MSRYGQRSRLIGAANANTINYWFGGGFVSWVDTISIDYLVVADDVPKLLVAVTV